MTRTDTSHGVRVLVILDAVFSNHASGVTRLFCLPRPLRHGPFNELLGFPCSNIDIPIVVSLHVFQPLCSNTNLLTTHAPFQDDLDTNDDLKLVDWSKDRLIVQRVVHGRSFRQPDAGCEAEDAGDDSSNEARSEIGKPMRVPQATSPAGKVAPVGAQASEALRKIITKAQAAVDAMDKQEGAADKKVLGRAAPLEKKLAVGAEKAKATVASDRQCPHSAGHARGSQEDAPLHHANVGAGPERE